MARPRLRDDQIGLLQGTLDMLILQTLRPGPAHGHQIATTIERTSDDVLKVDHGSLYPALHRLIKRGWITGILWTSEEPSAEAAGREVATAVHRVAHIRRHGPARTLREMLAQEGAAMAAAGCCEPALDPDDLAYTREMMEPHLGSGDRPTAVACLYGDPAAHELGYRPLGFSPRPGLALALETARRRG